ncbi:uncharacterized protein LOC131048544 isoform X1 [Cryptomeria japonica]|uniref:uncharacterized protein LOC131048544 isoform X1 n=1 Tax=Cryptomeria japonica TaxID=3369 RepID=UPI0027D9E64F|nr:uncharacterized protein LOC131048544 isoform X1 [Cryptomeria japonica]
MEEICAAHAKEWSVDLDMGLRSNKPGAHVEAIMKMGPRLQRWSEEPLVTALTESLFKLESWQDRAFANSILLRLADVFRTGNNFTQLCVLKVFLLELKKHHFHNNRGNYNGILAKERVPNHLEMVKRVKEVFSSGDIVARSLTLRVLGCLADLAKDSAEVQRLIIDATDSPYSLEVSAALFAAGCLCEFSKDFSSIVLKKVIQMVNAMRTIPETKVEAIYLFAKMVHSPTLACGAQEAGKSLMLKLPTDEIVTSTLLSLSKLAIRSVVTLADQVDLLLSYANADPRYIVRAMSLKCFRTLSAKAIRCISFHGKGFKTLLAIVKDMSLPTRIHCLALQVLSKLCHHYVTCVDAHQLIELVSITEISCLHPDWSKRQAAVSLLVDLTCNIEKLRPKVWDEVSSNQPGTVVPEDSWRTTDRYKNDSSQIDLPVRVTLLVFDQIAIEFKNQMEREFPVENARHASPVVKEKMVALAREEHFLFNIVLRLVGECPTVCQTAIDCIKGMVEALVKRKTIGKPENTKPSSENLQSSVNIDVEMPQCLNDGCEFNRQNTHFIKLMGTFCYYLLLCLDKLDAEGRLDCRVYSKVKQLTICVSQLDSSNYLLCYLIPALLKSCQAHKFVLADETRIMNDYDATYDKMKTMETDLCVFQDYYWAQDEKLTLDVASEMINKRSIWRAYKIGMHAACNGAWLAASSIFQCLVERVQSEACYCWLKSLTLLAKAENKIYAVLISSHGLRNLDEFQVITGAGKPDRSVIESHSPASHDFDFLSEFVNVMPEALNLNMTAIHSMSAAVNLDRTFEFQRWFLNLRGKLIKNAAELLGLLSRYSHMMKTRIIQEKTYSNMEEGLCSYQKQNMQRIKSLKAVLLKVSSKLLRLASEFDLLNTSFIDIDFKSFQCISSSALSCSLLSFCTLFVLHFPKVSIGDHKTSVLSYDINKQPYVAVIQDLAQRLRQMDATIWEELILFSSEIGDVNTCSMVMTCMSSSGHQHRAILRLCKLAISGVLDIQEQAKRIKHETEFYKICQNGLKLLADVTLKWFHFPSQIPKYFFQTRPRIGVELFAENTNERNIDGISVQQGFQLPLSLCVQVRNILPGSSCKVKKICCVMIIQPSDCSQRTTSEYYAHWRLGWRMEETQEVLELTEELLVHMKLITKSINISRTKTEFKDASFEKPNQKGKTFIMFELDKKGRGFSTCLLDVSSLPCGLYQTSWLCACLDNRGRFWSLQPLNAGPIFRIKPEKNKSI